MHNISQHTHYVPLLYYIYIHTHTHTHTHTHIHIHIYTYIYTHTHKVTLFDIRVTLLYDVLQSAHFEWEQLYITIRRRDARCTNDTRR